MPLTGGEKESLQASLDRYRDVVLWKIDGVGHNGFDDFCTFGNGTGIIGVAQASALGPVTVKRAWSTTAPSAI